MSKELALEPAQPIALPSYDALYAFIKAHYKHERFEGRSTEAYARGYSDYAERVVLGHMDWLERLGYSLISHHESNTSEMVIFDRLLQELPKLPIEQK